ncbi:unnamed protein product [Clonostachys rosea f. rosea IK726]|uniref:Mediator of RNA polymerase II transcription subunit 1 n=2 Tax=Bionectria ochroleuca TaxID=29856 RepID=A0A0B7KDY5_BIOOC|nr:unnamed protein product [Clonostachys rosea f. rosea IK726]
MSTPTPMKHGVSQQGRTPSQLAAATPPVSTPFSNPAQAAFSPHGPRSSPQHVKKSPATILGNMPPGALNFDSPSTLAAFGGQAFTDHEFEQQKQRFEQQNQQERAFASEADKLKRLEDILSVLNKKKGLVSEVGLERLAERNGFDCLKEDTIVSGGRKLKTLVIAGSSTQIDIVLDNNIVQNVTLAFPGLPEPTARLMEPAGQILLRDLKLRPKQSPLTKELDKFASNLERLAKLDQLSIVEAGFICHEALTGIYKSLQRLHEWDISKLREQPLYSGKPQQFLELQAMCSAHGVPLLHARDRVGLALQYWKERRFLPPTDDKTAAYASDEEKVWSMVIECAAMEGLSEAPARVSDDWISKTILKGGVMTTDPLDIHSLDWQEPDTVALPPPEEGKKDKGVDILQPDMMTTKRVPQVKFTATFDPPVILTHSDWLRLYEFVNIEAPTQFSFPPTFDVMHFPIPPGSTHDPSELRTITRQRRVRVFDKDGKEHEKTHKNTLFNYKRIYGMSIQELNFTHPKQLLAMLPLLRQYAFLSILLENSFGTKTQSYEANGSQQKQDLGTDQIKSTKTEDAELEMFLQQSRENGTKEPQSATEPEEGETNMDVILWVHPTPRLKVVFPFRSATANVEMNILQNGIVEITNDNILTPKGQDNEETRKDKGKALTRADLGKTLEYLEDLCKWTEWIRTRLS